MVEAAIFFLSGHAQIFGASGEIGLARFFLATGMERAGRVAPFENVLGAHNMTATTFSHTATSFS